MRTDQFDFTLPEDLIALRPLAERDQSRLLVVDEMRAPGLSDEKFTNLPNLLVPGDALVFNNTRVLPAALIGRRVRENSQVWVSVNLVNRLDPRTWQAFAKPGRRLAEGDVIEFSNSDQSRAQGDSDGIQEIQSAKLKAQVIKKHDDGLVTLQFDQAGASLDESLSKIGRMPLPPYIASRRSADAQDDASYQTVYATRDGAVAAPTAGLHFTAALLQRLKQNGLSCHNVTLHVGAGTFLPVKSERLADHKMHAEWGEISEKTAHDLNEVRRAGGRIIAVGTTSLRLLESAVSRDGTIRAYAGDTEIFITPGYKFSAIDGLITNFHLPKSTLFMLVCAFAGLERMKAAYQHAIDNRYRFYSYGDSSLLFPPLKSLKEKSS